MFNLSLARNEAYFHCKQFRYNQLYEQAVSSKLTGFQSFNLLRPMSTSFARPRYWKDAHRVDCVRIQICDIHIRELARMRIVPLTSQGSQFNWNRHRLSNLNLMFRLNDCLRVKKCAFPGSAPHNIIIPQPHHNRTQNIGLTFI